LPQLWNTAKIKSFLLIWLLAPCLVAFFFHIYFFPSSPSISLLNTSAPTPKMAAKEDRVLLPKDVVPVKYSISLTPDLKNFTFQGKEDVDVEVKNTVNKLTIHSLDIKVSFVKRRNGLAITMTYFFPIRFTLLSSVLEVVLSKLLTLNPTKKRKQLLLPLRKNSLYVLDKCALCAIRVCVCSSPVHCLSDVATQVGKGVLNVVYQGNLNDQMVGFYRSKYTVANETRFVIVPTLLTSLPFKSSCSRTRIYWSPWCTHATPWFLSKCLNRYMATTQMEPASARRAFPGWDEPAVKAIFEISLTVPAHMTALSNMEPVSQQRTFLVAPHSHP
jgi:hypothetical protein